MDCQAFLTALAASAIADDSDQTLSRGRQYPDWVTEIVEQIRGTASPQLLYLLNLAVGYLGPDEIYCEVGCFQGRSLVGALTHHSHAIAYTVDDFSEFDPFQDNFDQLIENLTDRGLSDQITFYYQDFEEFFADLRNSQERPTIGVYVYDAAHDYRSVLMGLNLAKPFLADQALIFLTATDWPSVQQASQDFLLASAACTPIFTSTEIEKRALLEKQGLSIYLWNRKQDKTPYHPYKNTKLQEHFHSLYTAHNSEREANAKRLYHEALILHHVPLIEAAILKYRDALFWTPDDPNIWQNLGTAYYLQQQYDLALKMLNHALNINPSSSIIYYNFGLVFTALEDKNNAIKAYETAINLDAHNVLAYNNLGNLLMQVNEIGSAELLFRKAISINSKFPGSYVNLANTLFFQDRLDEAIETYRAAISLEPRNSDTHYNLAILYQHTHNLTLAERYFGNASYYRKDYESAIVHYQRCCELATPTLDLYLALAQAHRELRDFQSAARVYQTACQTYPQSLELYHHWITALEATGRVEEAIAVAQQGIQYLPLALYLKSEQFCLLPIIYDSFEQLKAYQKRFNQGLENLLQDLDLSTSEGCAGALTFPELKNNFYIIYQLQNDRYFQERWSFLIHTILNANYPYWCQPRRMPPLTKNGKIRVGYISANISKNGVILLFHEWLRSHDRNQFEVYCFQVNPQSDHVTEAFKLHSDVFIPISNDLASLSQHSLATIAQTVIAQNLHILVFLEVGLTPVMWQVANLRLVPIQCVTWGHPITTGTSTIDYFLSNELMEPPDAEQYYSETLIRLPNLGIYCNQLSEKLDVGKSRQDYKIANDAIVYLCIQSLQKYLPQYDFVFPAIAQRVPQAKFVFVESYISSEVTQQFARRLQSVFKEYGLNADDYLVFLPREEYKNYFNFYRVADIFLDSFEFSGCLTTLDSLVYDLPIVTCPGQLMRGRQSYGILNRMGVTETIASNPDEYIDIATRLGLEAEWRQSISKKIQQKKALLYEDQEPLKALEKFYREVVDTTLSKQAASPDLDTSCQNSVAQKLLLHVGCGSPDPNKLPQQFRSPEWREVRLDIDPSVQPDLIGSITDLSAVGASSVDVVYSSHNLEHIYHHEVPTALSEFYRVLKPGGYALITLPDLRRVAEQVAQGKLEEPLYVSAAGPIAAIDILYGYGYDIARGNHFMAHKTGFTAKTLAEKLRQAGFSKVEVTEDDLNLWATATKAVT